MFYVHAGDVIFHEEWRETFYIISLLLKLDMIFYLLTIEKAILVSAK